MKIAYIAAGAAGMYCGSCLHDNTLAAAMQRRGHDVALIPTYTPIRTDEDDVSIDQVFYGAINVYLEQKSSLFRHTPWLFDKLLGSPALLDWVGRRGASTDARDLGALTLSVAMGEEGNQAKELEKLVTWLRDEYRPDLVHLTNSMFVGLARRIRRELAVPVVCSVQGEDLFLEGLAEPYASRVVAAITERTRDIDAFVAPSRYYARHMERYLGDVSGKMHVVPLGLKLDGHGEPAPAAHRPFIVGYLARICPEKGLHLLVDAFRRLADRAGRDQVRLRIAGWMGERDRGYLEGIQEQIRDWGLDGIVDVLGEVDRERKIEFLQVSHVLSVPTVYQEPKGLFALEAMANGIPVVLPRHGSFPEMLDATGGGLLFEPGSVEGLADALFRLMENAGEREALGRAGRQAVWRDYGEDVMAERTLQLYEAVAGAVRT